MVRFNLTDYAKTSEKIIGGPSLFKAPPKPAPCS